MNDLNYKIIFVDIDWTILDHEIHDWDYQSIEVLKELQKRGVLVYLNTARPYDSVVRTGILNVFVPDGMICTSGGVAFVNDKLLYANVFPEEAVRIIERVANKHHLVLELSTTRERYFTAKPNQYVHNYFSVFAEVYTDVRKYQNKDVSAILLFAPEKYDEVIKKEIPEYMDYLRFTDYGVDIGYERIDKGEAISKVLKHLNIDRKHAIAAGDSDFDIPMFEEVGLSIAMENGHHQAKETATIVCDPISEHGLGTALKAIFNI